MTNRGENRVQRRGQLASEPEPRKFRALGCDNQCQPLRHERTIGEDNARHNRIRRFHQGPRCSASTATATSLLSRSSRRFGTRWRCSAIRWRGDFARLERQTVLYRGRHRFHFLIGEQALRTVDGGPDVMIEQLDRLLVAMPLPRVVLGVIPLDAAYRIPLMNFTIFDRKRSRSRSRSWRS
ncbi:Scr1 family TA system antitoxin-like transcriptional regulator [Nocardia vinacea]|uniref:Scr1 family TA system antitoxin-like transcriptional regulator n=1 Tax=Nocardia vinacea TaxID=96468 RepID=UPI00342C091C